MEAAATPAKAAAGGEDKKASEKKKPDKAEQERKPLQHDEPTSDEWATGKLGRPAGELEVKEWGDTFYTAPK